MKNLLKMSDLSPAELTHILDVADQLKADCKAGRTAPLLAGKSVALLFSKASTRTRTSFEVGVYQMGGLGNYMNTAELQAGRGEPLRDTARVLGRYYDCAVWRTYRQRDLEELAELSGIPVINGLTDYAHPCQVLADLMTIRERRGTLAGLKLCFVGDGSNMANSLIVGGLLAGMQVSCVCPPGYRPAADVLMFAHKYGNAFHLTTDPAEGLRDADIVATAAWNTTAPGTAESEQRLRDFVGFQLTGRLLENAKPDALVLHCLPAHRGEEISTALFEQHADEIFDEAENRLHVQKAVLAVLLAVVTEDEKALTAANGIGKKIAQRVILELKDKLAREEALGGTSVKGGAPAMAAVPHSKKNEAQSALAVLGYGSAEIAAALKDIDMEALTLEDIIRQALKRMMK